jgi:muconolactone delta-isomerase
MKFFVDGRITPGVDLEPHLLEERARVKELKAEGSLIWAYRRTTLDGGAVMLVEAPARGAVEEVLSTLPFVRLGFMTCQIEAVESLEFIWA